MSKDMERIDCGGEGCDLEWTLNKRLHIATYHVPSNGIRGQRHVPAHTVEVETADDGVFADVFECPGCGYCETEGEGGSVSPCIDAGEHQKGADHRFQECPVYH